MVNKPTNLPGPRGYETKFREFIRLCKQTQPGDCVITATPCALGDDCDELIESFQQLLLGHAVQVGGGPFSVQLFFYFPTDRIRLLKEQSDGPEGRIAELAAAFPAGHFHVDVLFARGHEPLQPAKAADRLRDDGLYRGAALSMPVQ